MTDRNITEDERLMLKTDEFTIVESPEDKKRKRIDNVINLALENEARNIKYGEIVKTIKNFGFVDVAGIQCLQFEEVIDEIAFMELCKQITLESFRDKVKNPKFLYGDFKEAVQMVLAVYCDVEYDLPYIGSVFEFLDKNQDKKANLDLVVREKDGNRDVFANIKYGEKVAHREIPVYFWDNICEAINDEDFKREHKSREDKIK